MSEKESDVDAHTQSSHASGTSPTSEEADPISLHESRNVTPASPVEEDQDQDINAENESDASIPPSLPQPTTPLVESYTYQSPRPMSTGKYMIGIDEAGRGPVLGPLVYSVAYCPIDFKEELEAIGFKGDLAFLSRKTIRLKR